MTGTLISRLKRAEQRLGFSSPLPIVVELWEEFFQYRGKVYQLNELENISKRYNAQIVEVDLSEGTDE